VIQVVQGAAGNGPAVLAPAARPAPVAARSGRKTPGASKAPAAPAAWSDPFADKRPVASASKKEATARPAASNDSGWNDPFASEPEPRKAVRRTAPTTSTTAAPAAPAPKRNEKADPGVRPAGWKDPFTKAASEPARTPVAMRDLGKNESSKWEIATARAPSRRPAARASAAEARGAGGWGVLKKRAR
jgi:hypothetical protein